MYFLNLYDDRCYSMDYIQLTLREQNWNEIKVYKAKRLKASETGFFYCKHFDYMGEIGESCGKYWCDKYEPNNGKNGRCKYYGYLYEAGELITIKRKDQ